MIEKLDPKIYGLTARTVLVKDQDDELVMMIHRKSRIIMKDARVILKKIEMIKAKDPQKSVSVRTTAPVCSKSLAFFKEQGIKLTMADGQSG